MAIINSTSAFGTASEDNMPFVEETDTEVLEEVYQADADDTDEITDFNLDDELVGVAAQDFVDPAPKTHVYHIRLASLKQHKQKTDDGVIHGVKVIMECLATESEAAKHCVGGLFSIFWKMGGAIPEYEKYSAAKQAQDGKAQFKTFVAAFKPETTGSIYEQMEELEERYGPESGVCAKVRITAKESDEGYVNIKKVRCMAAKVDIDDIFDAATLAIWTPWIPAVNS